MDRRPAVDAYAAASRSVSSSATLRWTIKRRSVVHRCPAVPAAANTTARVVSARSADGATIAALFPPSSSKLRPRRPATSGASAAPIAVEPVALSNGSRASSAIATATSAPPCTIWTRSGGPPARSSSAAQASAVSGVDGLGFHTTGSPHTKAIAAFQAHTAAGKLKAVTTPTGPRGCQVSVRRWAGRSDAIDRPYSWRDRPTAKSQTSITSCTSPRASAVILPTSMLIRVARSSRWSRTRLPNRRTTSPRTGAGVERHGPNADTARSSTSSRSNAAPNAPRPSPVIGVHAGAVLPGATPQRWSAPTASALR